MDKWKLVPVEPTPEMLAAADRAAGRDGLIGIGEEYRAMLAAAPTPDSVLSIDPLDAARYRYLRSFHTLPKLTDSAEGHSMYEVRYVFAVQPHEIPGAALGRSLDESPAVSAYAIDAAMQGSKDNG